MTDLTSLSAVPYPAQPGALAESWTDLRGGIRQWRVSYLLGLGDIRRRYARSRLGQFWVTLTTAVTIGALGFVWSQLWRTPVADMMPFVAIGMVAWSFVSGVLTDAPTTFTSAAPIMHNQGMPFSTIIYAMVFKNLIVLAHNLPIVAIVLIAFNQIPGPAAFSALIGLALLTVFLFFLGYIVAIACLRFRDLTQVVQNSVTVIFFLTPVLWKAEQLHSDYAALLKLNPIAIYLALIQKPLLGGWPTQQEWIAAVGIALGTMLVALPLIGWARRRLIYWL